MADDTDEAHQRPVPSWEPPRIFDAGSTGAPRVVHREAQAPPERRAPAPIEVRDERVGEGPERVGEGPAAWIRSIGRELERFAAAGRPFAVLLVELADLDRMTRDALPGELERVGGQVQRTLEAELRTISGRAAGSLMREAAGRFWLIAPTIGTLRVGALAEQIAAAVPRSVSHRGRSVEVAVGTAVCPDDGIEAAALAAHADVALYAARADGSAGRDPAR